MGQKNKGTLIGATIKANDSADLYPVAEQSDIKGGHHSRNTIADRDAMPVHLREAGMECYVIATGDTYELKNDLVTWVLQKSSSGNTTLPGTGGDAPTIQLISGNFGQWTALGARSSQFFDEQIELKYKADLQAFPTRAIVYLQGQFGLKSDFTGTGITLGNIPANARPLHQLKHYMICKNIELFLVVETNGDVKLISKDGFDLPVAVDGEPSESEPYRINEFYQPAITTVEPTVYTASRSGDFFRNNCGTGSAGSEVTFSKEYTSTIDQATAEAVADANFDADGQAYANDPENGATCGFLNNKITITNNYSKPLYYAINGAPEKYINGSGQFVQETEDGGYMLRMDFNIPSETFTYWLYDPATYDSDNPATYQTGTIPNNTPYNVVISLGKALVLSNFKPIT